MNYNNWSREKLIQEIEMLREGMHQLSGEVMKERVYEAKRRKMQQFFEQIDLSLPGEHHTNQNTQAGTHDR